MLVMKRIEPLSFATALISSVVFAAVAVATVVVVVVVVAVAVAVFSPANDRVVVRPGPAASRASALVETATSLRTVGERFIHAFRSMWDVSGLQFVHLTTLSGYNAEIVRLNQPPLMNRDVRVKKG